MFRSFAWVALPLLATSLFAASVPAGYIAWDVNFPGNSGEFDIVNLTGANAFNPDFPIATQLNLSSLSLMVTFNNGTTVTEPTGYFSLDSDGESWDGTSIPIGGTNPIPTRAVLTGTFSPTSFSLLGGGTDSTTGAFSTTLSDSPTLVDGDLAVIVATTGSAPPPPTTPEPASWLLMILGLGTVVFGYGRGRVRASGGLGTAAVLLLPALVLSSSASAQVTLATVTAPDSGVSGVTNVNITGSSFPSGAITPADVTVTFANSCGGAAVTTVVANSVKTVIGSTKRVNFSLPSHLATGTYFLTIADSAAGDADFTTAAASCSKVAVTGSSATLNACLAGSSLGVLLPAGGATGNVTAYVPKGYWGSSATGIAVKNVEGTNAPTVTIPTAHAANSCSSNPATGQTVCVANNTDVYLVSGTSLTNTLSSSSNTTAGFSGGTCNNCGVAINALANTAVINMGLTGGTSNSGVQILNLNTNTFNTPFPMHQEVSENISVDPTRSLILSANEAGNYVLLQIQSDGTLKEFDSVTRSNGVSGGDSDSSAEDCSTGIALTPNEFTNGVFIEDLTQAVLTPGTPGTYTAPNSTLTLASSYSFAAGLDGSAVAQGSGHLAVVSGEFGGNTFAVLQLPSTSGSGTPMVGDYVSAQIPSNAACGGTFNAGFDPHTETAYTSPNDGKAYAVFTGYAGSTPTCLVRIDLAAVLNATRGGTGFMPHDISPANLPSSAFTFFAL